jgi:hypothetical protein
MTTATGAQHAYGGPIENLPNIPFTTLHRLEIAEAVKKLSAEQMLRWLISRIEDEYCENLVSDHNHPEIAAPLQGLVRALVLRMESQGLEYRWVDKEGHVPPWDRRPA